METTPPTLPVVGRPSSDDKLLIILCHLSAFLGVGIILPLVVYLVKKNEAGVTAEHAKEVLNFHLSLLVYALGALLLVLVGIGVLLMAAIGIGSVVLAIVAAVKASEGVLYRYPVTIRFIS
jgi:uncharacterized Tic20 family protein